MKLLFDQNISFRIITKLSNLFVNSSHVKVEGLIDKNDKIIWDFAKKNQFSIVTQDSDFNDLTNLYGFPPKIIWIRTGNINTKSIAILLEEYQKEIKHFIDDKTHGCFEIIKLQNE